MQFQIVLSFYSFRILRTEKCDVVLVFVRLPPWHCVMINFLNTKYIALNIKPYRLWLLSNHQTVRMGRNGEKSILYYMQVVNCPSRTMVKSKIVNTNSHKCYPTRSRIPYQQWYPTNQATTQHFPRSYVKLKFLDISHFPNTANGFAFFLCFACRTVLQLVSIMTRCSPDQALELH
jgi:hypothetical protein